jgi:hypothetical protein
MKKISIMSVNEASLPSKSDLEVLRQRISDLEAENAKYKEFK